MKRIWSFFVIVSFLFFSTTASAALIISSQSNDSLLTYDASSGALLGFLDNGGISLPSGVVEGPDGLLYAVSAGLNSVQRYDPVTNTPLDLQFYT